MVNNVHISQAVQQQKLADAEAANEKYLTDAGWVKQEDGNWSKPDPILVPTTIPEVLEPPVSLSDAPEPVSAKKEK